MQARNVFDPRVGLFYSRFIPIFGENPLQGVERGFSNKKMGLEPKGKRFRKYKREIGRIKPIVFLYRPINSKKMDSLFNSR